MCMQAQGGVNVQHTTGICGHVRYASLCLSERVCSYTVKPTSSVIESREDVASSYKRTGGFFSIARAMATRCFSPPETK